MEKMKIIRNAAFALMHSAFMAYLCAGWNLNNIQSANQENLCEKRAELTYKMQCVTDNMPEGKEKCLEISELMHQYQSLTNNKGSF